MNHDDQEQNQATRATKNAAKKGGQATKNGAKGAGRTLMFLFHFWWLGLAALIIVAIISATVFFAAWIGGGTEDGGGTNSCVTSDNSGAGASLGKGQNQKASKASDNYINRIEKSARKIAPKYGVLPSVVIADAGQENPSGPGNNFWGVGYNDNTVVHNQSYKTIDKGVDSYVNAAIFLTAGRVQTNNATKGLRAMAEADGQHPPERTYHTSYAYTDRTETANSVDQSGHNTSQSVTIPSYWGGLKGQFETYDLDKYDRGVHLNRHATISNLNDVRRESSSLTDDCSNNNSSTNATNQNGIYNYAAKFDGQLPYSLDPTGRLEFGNDLSSPKSSDRADCSSFVWGVLKATGYQVTANQWTTSDMVTTDKLEHINSQDVRQGDILVVNSKKNQHAMIVASDKWYGTNDKTQVISEGGGHNNVNQNSYAYAMGGDSEQPTFLRPKK